MVLSVLSPSESHENRPGENHRAADYRAQCELLVQEHRRENESKDNAELVNGNDSGDAAELQGLVVTQPGRSGGDAGQYQEQPAPLSQMKNASLRASYEHNPPRHQDNHNSSYSRGEI